MHEGAYIYSPPFSDRRRASEVGRYFVPRKRRTREKKKSPLHYGAFREGKKTIYRTRAPPAVSGISPNAFARAHGAAP